MLFNFEWVSPPDYTQQSILEIHDIRHQDFHRAYRVWDYSYANVEAWRHYGVNATLVPLGYSSFLTDSSVAVVPEAEKDIDVLFFGTLYMRCITRAFVCGGGGSIQIPQYNTEHDHVMYDIEGPSSVSHCTSCYAQWGASTLAEGCHVLVIA